ncbi:MAG: hypothetical protein EXX96DRAFT_458144, partial [Benjaminiella poitrasii]
MVRSLPQDKQNNIKSLLESGHTYSQITKQTPGLKKSTLSDYKNRLFPERFTGAAGRKSVVSTTTRSYIRKKLVTGALRTAKEVHRYLVGTGHDIGYSACLKILTSMKFQVGIKKKTSFLKAEHKNKRLAWAKAHQ